MLPEDLGGGLVDTDDAAVPTLGDALDPLTLDERGRSADRDFAPCGAEYDAAPTGEKGAILRRERLYHSHVIEWRQARDAGALDAVTDQRTAPVRPRKSAEQAELEQLRKKVARLEKDLARRDAALDVMGKANALLAWNCSPRARTEARRRIGGRRGFRRCPGAVGYHGGLPADRTLTRHPLPPPQPEAETRTVPETHARLGPLTGRAGRGSWRC
ncbi:hypothetical protein ACWY4P_09960 [Streptomyces sp. LZ34]